jgi:hypothetical protein
MVILSVLFVLKTSRWASVVPRKFVGGVVPALPVRDQEPWAKLQTENSMPSKEVDIFFMIKRFNGKK